MKPRVGHIKFLNCLPLYFGLGALGKLENIELISGTPTELNAKLIAGELDISPISSIEYAKHSEDLILLPDISISSNGPVKSILLVSKLLIEELGAEKIATTTASATSRILLKIILKEGYGLEPEFYPSSLKLEEMLEESPAALVIGDEALWALAYDKDHHLYDLGLEWKKLTGEAMVMAIWAARRSFAEKNADRLLKIHKALIDSMTYSLKHLDAISAEGAEASGFEEKFLKDYFETLRFGFGEEYQRGLLLFSKKAKEHGFLDEMVKLIFI